LLVKKILVDENLLKKPVVMDKTMTKTISLTAMIKAATRRSSVGGVVFRDRRTPSKDAGMAARTTMTIISIVMIGIATNSLTVKTKIVENPSFVEVRDMIELVT
jgi:hypothetical protein